MKRKILKKLVCVSGMLFIAIPAWSAVPSDLIPLDRTRDQAPVIADFGDHLFEGDMVLAKRGGNRGGNGGGGGNGHGGSSRIGSGSGSGNRSTKPGANPGPYSNPDPAANRRALSQRPR